MSNYDEENPIVSFRIPKTVKVKFDKFLIRRDKESRQAYLKNMFMEDMRKKEVVKVTYE